MKYKLLHTTDDNQELTALLHKVISSYNRLLTTLNQKSIGTKKLLTNNELKQIDPEAK